MSAARRASTPYARRLARERGLPIDDVVGSGPHGRITGADVLAFVAPLTPSMAVEETAAVPVPAPAPAPAVVSVAMRGVGSFQASVDLGPLAALIEAAGPGLAVAPFLVKAAARAAGPHGRSLLFRDADRSARVDNAATLSPGGIAEQIAAGVPADAPFVIEHHDGSGIRPLASGLPPWAMLKLVIVADAARAELLLVHDEAVIGSAEAIAMLAAMRTFAETPLRLLV